MRERHDRDEDWLARRLALNAGVDWDRLAHYPGYSRFYWREQADALRGLFVDDLRHGAPATR